MTRALPVRSPALRVALLAASLLLLPEGCPSAYGGPATASAQTRRRGATHRSSRSSRRRSSGSSRQSGRDTHAAPGQGVRRGRAAAPRRRRRRRGRRVGRRRGGVIVYFDRYDDCDYVDGDGYCVTYQYAGDGDPLFGGHLTVEAFAGILPTSLSGLGSDRSRAGVDLGVLPSVGGAARFGLGYDRVRFGFLLQLGGLVSEGVALGPADGAFEVGSRTGTGVLVTGYAYAAWLPQLSESHQLWVGLRAGGHFPFVPVQVQRRGYDTLARAFPSVGPEVGFRLTEDPWGALVTVFADALQPGVVQLSIAAMFDGVWSLPGARY